jgi:hypothetical protein
MPEVAKPNANVTPTHAIPSLQLHAASRSQRRAHARRKPGKRDACSTTDFEFSRKRPRTQWRAGRVAPQKAKFVCVRAPCDNDGRDHGGAGRNPVHKEKCMSSLRMKLVLSVVCALSSAAAVVGCGGGGSSSDDPVALCKEGCDKTISLCFKDAGSIAGMSVDSLKSTCSSNCTTNAGTSQKSCSNSSEIISAYKTCLGKSTCSELMSCDQTVPACKGGTTTGTGSGGTTGGGSAGRTSGGTSGSSGGGTCADLLACCNKAAANIKSACMSAYTQSMMSGGDSVCSAVLTSAKSTFCP